MLENTSARPTLLLIVAWAVGGIHLAASQSCCRSNETDAAVRATDVSPPAGDVVSARSVDELMNLLGAQIERRTAMLESLADHPDRFHAGDHAAIATTAYEESMIAWDLAALLAASKTSIPELCAAFEREVQEVEVQEMDAWSRLQGRAATDPRILIAVYGSEAAIPSDGAERNMARTLLGPGWRRFMDSHPPVEDDMPELGSAGDVASLCIQGGHSEELFEALR